MQTAHRVAKNTGILYAKMGITMFISLYTTRLILNALGAGDFGIFNIVGGAISMLGFLNSAMAGATQRFMSYSEGSGDKEKQKKIFNISLVIHFCIAFIMCLVLIIAGYFFFNGLLNISDNRISAAKVVYVSLILSTIFTVIAVPYDAVLNARENMLFYAIVGVIESLLKLVVALVIVNTTADKLVLYGILMACIPLVTITIMHIYCHKHYAECVIAPYRYWDKKLMKEMTSYAGWNFSSSATSMVGNYGLGILLNNFFGTILNASFGIASQLNGQLITFSNNMMKALNPSIVKAEGGGETQNMIRLALIGCKYSFFLFSVFAIPFLIETPIILKLWLKNVPDWAVVFCRLALMRTMIEQLTQPLNTAIGARGEIKSFLMIKSLIFLTPLPIIFVFFTLGFPAYTMLIVTLVIGGILDGINSIIFAIKKCNLNFSDYLKIVLKNNLSIFCGTILISSMPLLFIDESISRLLIVLGLSISLYLLLFYKVGLSDIEKNGIKMIVVKIKLRFFISK